MAEQAQETTMDRILQEISAVGRRLEGMDSMMASLMEETKSMCLVIAGFQSQVMSLEQRVTTEKAHATSFQGRDQELLYLRSKIIGLEERIDLAPSDETKPTVTSNHSLSLRHTQTRQLLQMAHKYGPFRMDGQEIRMTADFSKETSERRKAFLAPRPRLCQLELARHLYMFGIKVLTFVFLCGSLDRLVSRKCFLFISRLARGRITKILDTDEEENVPESDEGSSDEDVGGLLFPPPLKKPKYVSESSAVLDSEGVPMFDPGDIQHPNSTEWLPSEHVANYVTARLRTPLDKQVRAKLKSECPHPALSSKITATPAIDSSLLTFFTRYGKDPRKGVDKAWSTCQDKLLDIVGPLTRIFDIAEAARLEQVAIDPEELSLWAQRADILFKFVPLGILGKWGGFLPFQEHR
ncbi:hypothetical protein NDU88_003913 [Pleurodeles waltl]|uniref:Uncharacterized protein n=1 Tax=Pleurodeles waltl TaxID=8319 RepID=A0AAV7QEH7_PLEWA|nr:hypothetical protein NDU88_003913 [Pleurodeles waltl]